MPIAELVPGDLVKLSLGGVVPADVRISGGNVMLDQSTITGESQPTEASSGFETFAGALVRRGAATALVTATGVHTRFGRTAELVRTARVTSEQQKAIFRVVRNLALINGTITTALLVYAYMIALPIGEFIPLVLISVLATVPVALPATFTLATAIGAQALGRRGVLPTRLSAVDEAASMDVLCSDKTGTLTRNELVVSRVVPLATTAEADILVLASLASAEAGLDPVDRAVQIAAKGLKRQDLPALTEFIPFDPASKMSQAICVLPSGLKTRIAKGAFARIAELCTPAPGAQEVAEHIEREGYRVLALASGPSGEMQLLGLLALSDPPRGDARPCIAELRRLGVKTAIISGDTAATVETAARQVGVEGHVFSPAGDHHEDHDHRGQNGMAGQLQTLTLVTLVFSGQAIFYVVRERRRIWSSMPSRFVILCSIADLLILPTLAYKGLLIAPIKGRLIASVFIASIGLAFLLDAVKAFVFRRLRMV